MEWRVEEWRVEGWKVEESLLRSGGCGVGWSRGWSGGWGLALTADPRRGVVEGSDVHVEVEVGGLVVQVAPHLPSRYRLLTIIGDY